MPRGLGTDEKMLRRICAEDKIALEAIDDAVQNKVGAPAGNRNASKTTVDNVHSCTPRPSGNDKQRALRKLRKDRPDLHAKVLAKDLSPQSKKATLESIASFV